MFSDYQLHLIECFITSYLKGLSVQVRSLHLAENMLSTVDREDFSSLMYLIDLDLSANNIHKIHPEAFM